MADLGAAFTDAEIAKTEKELKAVYNKAYKDILQKQKDFNEKYKVKEEKKLKQVASGQMTQEEFDHWKKGQVFQGKQWENKKKQILGTIYKTNEVATGIVNGKTHNVFAFNANYTAYDLEHGAGVNFGFELYDEATVVNLIKNDPQLLPKWKIDQPKDYTWNQKKLNRQINLGIIEGESLDKIANRLSDVLVTQNFNKMRTFARTAMTGAQNSGRQIRLEEAKKLGINLKKEWMATLDAHTRINHRELDGQKVEMEESFEIKGIKIRYPGDPLAPPAMVYNCRCTMVGDLTNYPATYDRYDNIDGKRIKGMTYKEWEEAKKKGDDISPVPLTYAAINKKPTVVQGKDISAKWQRRADKFDFEIEDIVNAQGFDGLPKIVSAEEFDDAVKESNFIAQRAYTAPDKEALEMYRNSLYHGKWYIDCSIGGSVYGKGMYCDGRFATSVNERMEKAMRGYGGISPNGLIETFTLTKDAKILNGSEIQNVKNEIMKERMLSLFDGYNFSENEKQFIYSQAGLTNMDELKEVVKWMSGNSEKMSEIYQGFMKEKMTDISNIRREIDALDNGSIAALKGYDAINCNNVTNSDDGYFIILNRTKCIFKGE